MKISQLKEVIRTKVRESLTVKTGGRILTPQQQSQQIDQIKRTTGDQTAGSINNPVNFVKENDKIKPGQVDTKTLKNVKLKNGTIYKNVRFHMLNDPKSFVKSDGGYMINQDIQSFVDANQELKENNKITAADIDKMGRSELIDFLGLGEKEAINWSDKQLFGAARNLADEEGSIDEADYLDDDDEVREGVDDDNTDFNQYDRVYEDMEDNSPDVDKYKLGEVETNDRFEANVGSGHRGLSVKSHPMDPRLVIVSQDNGQKVIVEVEDIPELINILRELA
jgi:hypothetical protein